MTEVFDPNSLDLSNLHEWLPLPYIIIDKDGSIVFLNHYAENFLDFSRKNELSKIKNLNDIIIDSYFFPDLIKELNRNIKCVHRKMMIRLLTGEITLVEITASYVKPLKERIFIHIHNISSVDKNYYLALTTHYKKEIHKLKPYLNKAGQALQEEILLKELSSEIAQKSSIFDNRLEIVHQDRLVLISQLFPTLTPNELFICSLLSLKLSYDEIAKITKKSNNSLRVSLHRMLVKLKFANASDFFSALSDGIS